MLTFLFDCHLPPIRIQKWIIEVLYFNIFLYIFLCCRCWCYEFCFMKCNTAAFHMPKCEKRRKRRTQHPRSFIRAADSQLDNARCFSQPKQFLVFVNFILPTWLLARYFTNIRIFFPILLIFASLFWPSFVPCIHLEYGNTHLPLTIVNEHNFIVDNL